VKVGIIVGKTVGKVGKGIASGDLRLKDENNGEFNTINNKIRGITIKRVKPSFLLFLIIGHNLNCKFIYFAIHSKVKKMLLNKLDNIYRLK